MLFLLGDVPEETYKADQRYILWVLLLIAKKMIAVDLKDTNRNSAGAEQEHKQVYIMETMTAGLLLKMDTFLHWWLHNRQLTEGVVL